MFEKGGFLLCMSLYLGDLQALEKYWTWTPELQVFLIGSATLGLLCAWFGAYLWNQASVHLPVFHWQDN